MTGARDLVIAWGALIGLSLGSTLLAMDVAGPLGAAPVGALILALAWAKARLILNRYLGLDRAPFWRRGFAFVMAIYSLVLLGLFLAG